MKKIIIKCNACIYGSLGRCINCGGRDNWIVTKTFSTTGNPIFFIKNGKEEFVVINPKIYKVKVMTKKELGDFGKSIKYRSRVWQMGNERKLACIFNPHREIKGDKSR